jgi:hypothetical protein
VLRGGPDINEWETALARSPVAAFAVTAALAFGLWAAPAPTRAAVVTIAVTRTDDPVPNGCRPRDCSLREAVIAANYNPGSTVKLLAKTYTLTLRGLDNAAPNPAVGDLDIRVGMTIQGVDAASTVIQSGSSNGAGVDRILDVFSTRLVTVSGLTIRNGRDVDSKSGGCIRNTGNLSLDGVTVTGCSSPIRGGGISSYGNLTIANSLISSNSVTTYSTSSDTGGGGGIAGGNKADGTPGRITIDHSQIDGNSVTNLGGLIAYGGGFSNVGVMTIRDSTISNNRADSSAGGISGASGKMTINRSTFRDNKATRDAGGLDNDGVLKVLSSTFADNQAGYQCTGADCKQAFAGGLLSTKTATTTVDNSTFSGNSCGANGAGMSGGGLLGNASMTIRSSTVVDNTCPLGAGVTSNAVGSTHLMDTIVAGNHSGKDGGDCSGEVTSDGYNVLGSTHGCTLIGNLGGNVSTTDPGVAALADNGGPTYTLALLSDSRAVNAGRPAGCLDTTGKVMTQDQRGFVSPRDGRCDIGAFELQQ